MDISLGLGVSFAFVLLVAAWYLLGIRRFVVLLVVLLLAFLVVAYAILAMTHPYSP